MPSRAFVLPLLFASVGYVSVVAAGCTGSDDPHAATDALDASADAGGAIESGSEAAAADDGSSEAGAAAPDERGGARIKLDLETASDGFRRSVGLYDAQLDVACAPSLADDGVVRCLPSGGGARTFFADSACTQPVARLLDCEPNLRYATLARPTALCTAAKNRVFAMGAEVTPAKLWDATANGCEPAPLPSANDKHYALTEVPAGSFAPIDSATHPVAPGLSADTFETPDGLRKVARLRDVAHGSPPCTFSNAVDDQLRCLPPLGGGAGVLSTLLFADSNCTSAVATAVCGSFSIASHYVGGCPGHFEMFSVGAPLDADAGVFQKSGADCNPSSTTFTAAPVAAPLPPTEFVLGTPVPSTATSRLRIDPLQVAPNVQLTTTSYAPSLPIRDTAKDTTCRPRRAADGKTRCLPSFAASADAFADDQCTTPVALVIHPECAVPKFAEHLVVARPDCPESAVLVYPMLGKRGSTLTYVRNASSQCVAQDLGATADVYDVGPEIAASEFVEITNAHE